MHQASGDTRGTRLNFVTSVPSAHEGLNCAVRVSARWQCADARRVSRSTLRAHLRLAIRESAADITRGYSVLDSQAARDALVTRLRQWRHLADLPDVCWRLTGAKVTVGSKERDRAREHNLMLAEEHSRSRRANARLEEFRKILADGGLFCAWWLQHVPQTEPPGISTLTALKDLAAEIAKLPPSRGVDPQSWLAELAGWFWVQLTHQQQSIVIDQFSDLARLLNKPEVADRLATLRVEPQASSVHGNGADPVPNASSATTGHQAHK